MVVLRTNKTKSLIVIRQAKIQQSFLKMIRLTILTLNNHQIMPYKRRLKIDKIMLAAVALILLNNSCSFNCSIINSAARDNLITYQSQLAKEEYLKSLQDALRSQLRNISSLVSPQSSSSSSSTTASTTTNTYPKHSTSIFDKVSLIQFYVGMVKCFTSINTVSG